MEFPTALDLVARDIVELGSWLPFGTLVVLMTLALPVASLAAVLRGHRAAWLSVLVSVVTISSWLLYYATHWWTNPGQGIWVAMAVATVVGWAFLLRVLLARRRTFDTERGPVESGSPAH